MRTTRLVLMSLALSALVSACAPAGDGGDAPAGDPGGTFFAPMSMENRDLSFASHILLSLSDLRRMLDDSQTLFPNTRQQARPGDLYEFGCRNLKKIWPDPDSAAPTTYEKFAVLYNCLDGGSKFARADLRGAESYDLGYPEPLPILGDPKPRPIANTIAIDGQTTYTAHFKDGTYEGDDEVKVARKTTLRAQIAAQSLADLLFTVDLVIEDSYTFDVSRTYRDGLYTTHIVAKAIVDKKTRKVKALTPTEMTITVNGTQYDKSGIELGAPRANPVPIALTDYVVAVDGPVKLNPDACEFPEAKLVIKKNATSPTPTEITVASGAGKITIDGVGESQLKACDLNRAADPLYAQVLEGLFF